MNDAYKGSCLCGAVTFTVNGFNEKAANCHCTMCRKFHGAAYGTSVGVVGLNWISGIDYLKEFIALNGTIRTFCYECGSSLGFRVKGTSLSEIELAIATFDSEIPVVIDAHIYIDNKASWCALQDELPKYNKGR
ncbi:GFA family protein [Pseudoalteromonas sp. TB64]|uniref:GFA family protein n=1 Tax=Pseudoalteromonas sp. TB64 TaxID=1938600 RepID=UPI0004142EFB|nr:GFA family protein [Pseudoalteromonas sp. TB64]